MAADEVPPDRWATTQTLCDAEQFTDDHGWHLVNVKDDPRPVARYRWPLGGWSESPADDGPDLSDALVRVLSDRLIELSRCDCCDEDPWASAAD